MINVLIFVGSRANYGRLVPLLNGFSMDSTFDTKVIRSENCLYYGDWLIKYPNKTEHNDKGSYKAITIAKVTSEVVKFLELRKIDFNFAIVHGDRFECLGFAIACHSWGIPIVHMESGEITDTDNDVRWAISSLSKYHICPTAGSSFSMNFANKSDGIQYNAYNYGSTVVDYIKGLNLGKRLYEHVLISYNPYNTEADKLFVDKMIVQILKFNHIQFKWIVPNNDPGSLVILNRLKDLNIYNLDIIEDLTPQDYLFLMNRSKFMVGNSSSGIKEAYVLGVLNIMVKGRQGKREIFDNTVLVSLNELSILLYQYLKSNRQYVFSYGNELGFGDTTERVIKLLKHEMGYPSGSKIRDKKHSVSDSST